MKNLFIKIFLIHILFIINLSNAISTIHPSKQISVTVKEGFIVHLNTTKEFGKIKNCFYKIGDGQEIEIKLNVKVPQTRESGETILPYSKTKCGIRVDNLSHASSDKWSLKAVNSQGVPEEGIIMVTVSAAPKYNFETIFKHELGATYIKCANSKGYNDPQYCKIYDDVKILSDTCSSPIVVRNKTSYNCNTLRYYTFNQSKETISIEPIVKKIDGVTNAITTENDDYIIMTCQFPKNVFHCKAEYPDGIKSVLLTDGLMSGRLTALDTDINNGKCVLEIKKPLKPEEIGIWTISKIDRVDSTKPSGCMFHVGEKKSILIENAINKKKSIETIEIINTTKKFDLRCKAPFSIELCYLVDPNNNIHFPDDFKFLESKTLGYCDFSMDLLAGEYICGFSGTESYESEYIQKYKVIVTNDSGEAVTPLIKTNIGESIDLLCRVPYNTIVHCVFVDPQRNIYYSSNFIKSIEKNRISYFGDGIEQGHCGIKVDNIQEDELGLWKCHIKLSNYKTSTFDIKVELIYHGLSEASSIGLGLGLSCLVILITIGLVVYYRKKGERSNETSTSQEEIGMASRRRSIDSGDSHTSKES